MHNTESAVHKCSPSKHSSWWRHLEKVLKSSFVFVFRKRLQDVFKTSWSRRIYSPNSHVFRRHLQNVFIKTNIIVLVIRLQDVFNMFLRRLQNALPRHLQKSLQDVFKTSSRCLQDVLKTSSRSLQGDLPRHLQDVLQKRLQDIFKTFQGVFKTSSRRLQDV